jgi:c(7)-type cytochrome triheme protein
MPRQAGAVILLVAACAALLTGQTFQLPPHPPPADFGNVVINRTTAGTQTRPVVFSHRTHRLRYTCRVCHLELDFALQRNATEITEEASRNGEYCGACHNGKISFAHTNESCARCHTDAPQMNEETRNMLADLPVAKFGNSIDWSAALATGKIQPVSSLSGEFEPLALDTTLSLEAEWNFVPPAIFPHAEHVRVLDCANCHPSIFNVKKKTTRHFSMKSNLAGEFCGVCHLRVAFPMDDCRRCHPAMKAGW